MVLLDRAKDEPTRLWYLHASVEYGWSRNVLVHMIKGDMHLREGKAISNFSRTLPPEGSDIAKPIGVSTYRVTHELPAPLQQDLPSIEDLEEVVEKLRSDFEAARKVAEEKAGGEEA